MKVTERQGANHALHLVLSILTMGLWAVTGWPVAAMMGRKKVTRYRAPDQNLGMVWNPYSGRWVPRG